MDNPPSNEYFVKRGELENDSPKGKKFSGIIYCVRFSSNKPVKLTGVQFCPVHSLSKGLNISLAILVRESLYNNPSRTDHEEYMTRSHFNIKGDKESNFTVRFPTPVAIPESTMVEIGFELDPEPPDECVTFQFLDLAATSPQSINHEESDTVFEFYHSSSQLSGIYFEINNDELALRPKVPKGNISACAWEQHQEESWWSCNIL